MQCAMIILLLSIYKYIILLWFTVIFYFMFIFCLLLLSFRCAYFHNINCSLVMFNQTWAVDNHRWHMLEWMWPDIDFFHVYVLFLFPCYRCNGCAIQETMLSGKRPLVRKPAVTATPWMTSPSLSYSRNLHIFLLFIVLLGFLFCS